MLGQALVLAEGYTWSNRSGSIQALKANSSVTGPTTMLRHHCMRAQTTGKQSFCTW